MKIKVLEQDITVAPKQTEGKVVVLFFDHSVKPKPNGVVVQKHRIKSVLKTDRRIGVRVQKKSFSRVLKGQTEIYSSSITTDSLVVWLDAANTASYSGSGTVWNDLSGNSNHFNIYNSPEFGTSRFVFDGADDYMRSANTLDLSATNAVTVQYLFRVREYPTIPDPNPVKVLFELSDNFNGITFDGATALSKFGSFYGDGSGQFTPKAELPISMGIRGGTGSTADFGYNFNRYDKGLYSDNGWKFCNLVMDRNIPSGTQNLFYTQGVLRNTNTPLAATGAFNFANDYLFIAARGSSLGTYNANIELSHFAVYNRRLTQREITNNYNALKGRYGI